ncbi:flagellar biosynthesis protein FliR [Shewanella mangrovi]|uniref:Flagellar biosynthetic protein FliR n=1 Tax=Shewanella mangrovi TaxID=1515746 RepID=A0A094JG06_9GAMM|nr:flagellar biosynthetic protein FliR [Shewanella mangrovi]KFZ38177.1 flagellar biosynthesis protein FliR [Shewanella mangrovi]
MSALVPLLGTDLMHLIGAVWWPFVRLSTFLWALPVMDNPAVPVRGRILLAFFLAFALSKQLPEVPEVDPFSLTMVAFTLEQVVFGLCMGLVFRMLFEVFNQAGLILSMQMGLSMAMVMDPASGDQVSILGNLLWLMMVLLFFALNGHLLGLQMLVDSFQLWPVGHSLYALNFDAVLTMFGWIFASALLVALPAVIAMLLVNMTFGIASRSAPSLNLFSFGFPVTLMLGFVVVYLTFAQAGSVFSQLLFEALDTMRRFMVV